LPLSSDLRGVSAWFIVEDLAFAEDPVPQGLPFKLVVFFLARRFARFARLGWRLPTSWRGA
jgi:hypothetical protein